MSKLLLDDENEVHANVISCWEIQLKIETGKLTLPDSGFLDEHWKALGVQGYLPLNILHGRQVFQLPRLHTDAFDRILLAQAIVEGWTLVQGPKHGQVSSENSLVNARAGSVPFQRTYDVRRPFNSASTVLQSYDSSNNFSIAGTPTQSSEMLLAGAPNATWDMRSAYTPPKDAVQEVRVKVLDTDAVFGHTRGGTINQVLKTGTNQLHGSLWDPESV